MITKQCAIIKIWTKNYRVKSPNRQLSKNIPDQREHEGLESIRETHYFKIWRKDEAGNAESSSRNVWERG